MTVVERQHTTKRIGSRKARLLAAQPDLCPQTLWAVRGVLPAYGPFQRFTAFWPCLWQVTRRKKLRLFFEELKVEVTIMVFVIVYALFIFVDLAVATASNVRPSQHQRLV